MLSQETLDAIRSRCEAATPGPWTSWIEGRDHFGGSSMVQTPAADLEWTCPAADLDFIAAARQDVPLLLEEVERLRRLLATTAPTVVRNHAAGRTFRKEKFGPGGKLEVMPELVRWMMDRPGMYLGQASLKLFTAFIHGYTFADGPESDAILEYLKAFDAWLRKKKKFDIGSTEGWFSVIGRHAESDEAALDLFESLSEEFVDATGWKPK